MSTITPLRPQQKAAEQDGSIHRDLYRWLARLTTLDLPMNYGVLFENVALTSGTENLLAHGLGEQFRTWYVADAKSPAIVYRYTASTADLATYLPLLTTADCTVDIVVVP